MPILADCSSKGLESTEFSFDQQISPVQFGSLIPDDSEEENLMQPPLHKRGGYVSQSAVALRCRVMPPPCVKNPYLNMDPCIDDAVYGGRQCNSAGIIYVFHAIKTPQKHVHFTFTHLCAMSSTSFTCTSNM
jgi:wee1-like protein kinase